MATVKLDMAYWGLGNEFMTTGFGATNFGLGLIGLEQRRLG